MVLVWQAVSWHKCHLNKSELTSWGHHPTSLSLRIYNISPTAGPAGSPSHGLRSQKCKCIVLITPRFLITSSVCGPNSWSLIAWDCSWVGQGQAGFAALLASWASTVQRLLQRRLHAAAQQPVKWFPMGRKPLTQHGSRTRPIQEGSPEQQMGQAGALFVNSWRLGGNRAGSFTRQGKCLI